jgi:hypothetical protein
MTSHTKTSRSLRALATSAVAAVLAALALAGSASALTPVTLPHTGDQIARRPAPGDPSPAGDSRASDPRRGLTPVTLPRVARTDRAGTARRSPSTAFTGRRPGGIDPR